MKEEVKTGDFVVPGEFLATAEEFVPDEGVYEENSGIYSAVTGVTLRDIDSKKISVHPKTETPPEFSEGDIVIGRITNIRGQIANVDIGAIRGKNNREIPFSVDAIIHISEISDDYVDEIRDEFRPLDIIRAKVKAVGKDSVKLTTKGESLGVLVAFCSRCRNLLEKKNSKLKCPHCGDMTSRKITNDYRQGIL